MREEDGEKNIAFFKDSFMIQDARGWCTGMIQRGGIGREVEGGFRMGNTCTPMADSC